MQGAVSDPYDFAFDDKNIKARAGINPFATFEADVVVFDQNLVRGFESDKKS